MTTAFCGLCHLWRPFPHLWGCHRSSYLKCGNACKQPRLTHAPHMTAFVFLNGEVPREKWDSECQSGARFTKIWIHAFFLKLEGNTRLLMMVMSGCVFKFPSLVFKYSTMSVNFYNWEKFHILYTNFIEESCGLTFLKRVCSPPVSRNPHLTAQIFLTTTGRALPGVSHLLTLWSDIVVYKVQTWEVCKKSYTHRVKHTHVLTHTKLNLKTLISVLSKSRI